MVYSRDAGVAGYCRSYQVWPDFLHDACLVGSLLSELDPERRHELLQMISEPGQQTIITDTEARNYDQLTPIIYHVDQGHFIKVGSA